MNATVLVLCCLALLLLTCVLLRKYAGPHTSRSVRCVVFVSWMLGFLGSVLLPFDIAEALLAVSNGSDTPPSDAAVGWVWVVVFGVTWALSWVVMPIMLDYELSGEFTQKRRFVAALRANLLLYAVGIVAVTIIYAVAHFVVDGGGDDDGGGSGGSGGSGSGGGRSASTGGAALDLLIAAGNVYGM